MIFVEKTSWGAGCVSKIVEAKKDSVRLRFDYSNLKDDAMNFFAQSKPVLASLKKWYEGEFIPYENVPGTFLIRIGGYHQRPILARVWDTCYSFYLKHWQWCVATFIAVIALTIQFTRTH